MPAPANTALDASAEESDTAPRGTASGGASADGARASGQDLSRWWRTRGRGLAVESVALFAFCTAVAVWIYRAWEASLRVPFFHLHDARLVQVYVTNTLEHGWWWSNPDLGAPFGGDYLDLPHGGEHLQFLVLKVLGVLVGNDVGLTINLYYLAGFGVTAVAAHLVMRHLGFSWQVSGLVAVAFTFLPFHIAHHQQHLWRSVYPNVPLMALLVVWCATPRQVFLADPEATDGRGRARVRGNLRRGPILAALAMVVFVASWETMNVAFGLSVLASAAIVVAVRQRAALPLLAAGAVAVAMFGVFLVQNLPTFVSFADSGTNEVAARRLVTESEYYGLKLSRMLLPAFNHRSDILGELGLEAIDQSPVPSENGQSIGLLGTAGFVGAAIAALAYGLVRRPRAASDRRHLLGLSGVGALLGVLFGTIGGLSVILAIAGFSQVRVWNRIVVLIAFFSFVALAIGLERAVEWARARPRGHLLAMFGLCGLLALNLWDTARANTPDYDAIDARVESVRGFVDQVESRLEPGAAVFQLPVVPFPEHPPVEDMVDYDHFAPYLQSDTLRWSYGSVKGRPEADWQLRIPELPTPMALATLAGMDFEGIWIDRNGYPDGGAAVEAEFAAELGPPLESGRYAFFDLRPWVRDQGWSEDELRAVAEAELGISPPG